MNRKKITRVFAEMMEGGNGRDEYRRRRWKKNGFCHLCADLSTVSMSRFHLKSFVNAVNSLRKINSISFDAIKSSKRRKAQEKEKKKSETE